MQPPSPCGGCSPGLRDWGRICARMCAEQAAEEQGWSTGVPPSLAGSCRQRTGTGSGEVGSLALRSCVVGGSIGGQLQAIPFHPSSWGYAPRLSCGPYLHRFLLIETRWRLKEPTPEVSPLYAQPPFYGSGFFFLLKPEEVGDLPCACWRAQEPLWGFCWLSRRRDRGSSGSA